MRQEIETRWNLDAVDIYGLSEVMGPGVAQECIETKDGATIWEDHFYPEIIDPASGAVLPDGARGELALTTLTKEGMPVIRYRTRDLTALLPPSAHPGMRRMARITGRSDDMLIIRGVNIFPTQIEELILADPILAPQFRLILDRNGHLDTLEVQCERRANGETITTLANRIKEVTGVTAAVSVLPPNTLERGEGGKAIRVIDKRK
jgi:phenylacetate-CoA ligase